MVSTEHIRLAHTVERECYCSCGVQQHDMRYDQSVKPSIEIGGRCHTVGCGCKAFRSQP